MLLVAFRPTCMSVIVDLPTECNKTEFGVYCWVITIRKGVRRSEANNSSEQYHVTQEIVERIHAILSVTGRQG